MKKYHYFVLGTLLLLCLSGCGKSDKAASTASAGQEEKLQVVATIFPEYDWVREILGENGDRAELTLLLDNGVDLHSYQPTASDILKISTCDLFLYVGGESDEWVEDALQEAVNPDMVVINLMEELGDRVKEEELVPGMEHEHDHEHEEEHDHEHEGEHEEEHHHEADEHVWLSLGNAKEICEAIAQALSQLDPEKGAIYEANKEAYLEKLTKLDGQYREAVEKASVRTLLFGDRFPFRYLTDDYGLAYYAAFSGCSAEAEASFETITFLANKVDELDLSCVLTLEKSDQKIADTIVQNTQTGDRKILALNSMQSVTSEDISQGASYLSIMEENLDVLKEALQ